MRLALSGQSALAALRSLRAEGRDLSRLPRIDLLPPDPSPAKRWTKTAFKNAVSSFARDGQLEVAVCDARFRIRTTGITSVVYSSGLPEHSFLDIGGGLLIPCPELLFIEMSKHLTPIALSLLGMELCGSYSRPGTYQIAPVTSRAKLASYLDSTQHVNGTRRARRALTRVLDNAWSPMEAIVAALISLPTHEMGYGLRKAILNSRSSQSRRIPDIVFGDTGVGLNYEGTGHLDLQSIVSATTEATLNPNEANHQKALDETLTRIRDKYVDDRRRERELWEAGLTVFPVTKEDLYQVGALDSLMLQVYTAIEQNTGRSMRTKRERILDRRFYHERQLRIWSLLPGEVGNRAREELLAAIPTKLKYFEYVVADTEPMDFVEVDWGSIAVQRHS